MWLPPSVTSAAAAQPGKLTASTNSLTSAAGQEVQVLVKLRALRSHTGNVRPRVTLVPVRGSITPAARQMMRTSSTSGASLLWEELRRLTAREGVEQEISTEAMALLMLGARNASAAAVDCCLHWLHEGWEAQVQMDTTAFASASTALQPRDSLHRGPMDLQAVFAVMREARGDRSRTGEGADVQNVEVLQMVLVEWVRGCTREQWMTLMAFACAEQESSLIMRLMASSHGTTGSNAQHSHTSAEPSDIGDATKYVETAVSKARNLYLFLARRRALDAEQRDTGAAGLTPPEREQLDAKLRFARARLAQLGQPAPSLDKVHMMRR